MKRLALLVLFLPVVANAWPRAVDGRIAKNAATLAPPDLRLVLEKLAPEYKSGLDRAQTEEGDPTHRDFLNSRDGRLRQRIESETALAIKMIRGGDPMSQVAEHLGILAHLVGDANNPFHLASGDPRLRQAQGDFEQYLATELPKFPTVFYGLDDDPSPRALLGRTFERTRGYYPLLGEEYFRGGVPRTSADFDERSTAFGVAAVCYSHSVTDLVNLYYYIWRQAGGDVRAAKLMKRGNLLLSGW